MPAVRVRATGIVQGVGFRPFVYTLARSLGLRGWVRNDSSGVEIRLEGGAGSLQEFLTRLREDAPPLARIDRIESRDAEPGSSMDFRILVSRHEPGGYLPVPADVTVCRACLREMQDPADRRYRYPFINCTHCGPRFTLIRGIPYDRPATTMAGFPLCPACASEYADPADRRFHAQPVACPACGPQVWMEAEGRRTTEADLAVREARTRLAAGGILAVKSLGGFHLACNAYDAGAVRRLRERKGREAKPFALMAASLEAIRKEAEVPPEAIELLESPERPVVLLPRSGESGLPEEIAPGRDRLGFMLPYTPLHHLMLEEAPGYPPVLVMTSGNRSDEPIAFEDADARLRLAPLADAFLLHDRPIHVRCDDSVVAVHDGAPYFMRRSRGYAPRPIRLPFPAPSLLAVGGELKNTFCFTRDDLAFVSHYIGDLDYEETVRAFEEGVDHYRRLFRVEPELLVHDLHPDYRSTIWARDTAARTGIPATAVQHHHAHIASAMADHGLPRDARVIGVAFDGTGYGPDGAVWGGEFLVAGYADFERAAHLRYAPLAGGDAAVRSPYRVALAWMREAGIPWDTRFAPVRAAGEEEREVLESQLRARVNVHPTSSAGRLFDAAAALAGFAPRITYEAQAACEFEAAADRQGTGLYPFPFEAGVLDPRPAVAALAGDAARGVPPGTLSMRFHRGLARAVADVCRHLRERTGHTRVLLSGGVWQNVLLLELASVELEALGFEVLVHRQVPANDGGLSLGQAAVAAGSSRGA